MNGHRYTYRAYRAGDKPGALASFAQAFGYEAARAAEQTFDWKYLQNPFVSDGAPALQILERDGDVVGMQGGMLARFKLGSDTLVGAWGCDAHVSPSDRDASTWFFRHVADDAPSVALSMPNDVSSPILVELAAVERIGRMIEYKACLDLESILKARGRNALLSWVGGLAYSPVATGVRLLSASAERNGIAVEEIPRFDARFDSFWQETCTGYPGIMVRDYEFLSWRFDRCPNRRYVRYCAQRNGKLAGYLVARIRQINGVDRGRIVDYVVPRGEPAALDVLLYRAMHDFRSRGVASVACSVATPDRAQIRLLRRHGFLQQRQEVDVVATRVASGSPALAVSDWFFTYADSDIDYWNFDG